MSADPANPCGRSWREAERNRTFGAIPSAAPDGGGSCAGSPPARRGGGVMSSTPAAPNPPSLAAPNPPSLAAPKQEGQANGNSNQGRGEAGTLVHEP